MPRSLEELATALEDADPEAREQAARELGEAGDTRAVRHLIASLGDQSPPVAAAAVRALERLGEPSAVMPLYELVQNETADPGVRRAAADALVAFGLLRRERVGPSRIFMWLLGILLLIVSLAAASSIGAFAILLFAAGVAALVYYSVRAVRQERGAGEYIGPDGAAIHAPLDDAGGL